MVNTFLKNFKTALGNDWKRIATAVTLGCLASSAFAETAWGGDALCLVATNTKLTIGIAAVIGILLGGVMAMFKKGDHLLDTVITIVIVCGVAALASTIITKMGYAITCAGVA
jgi:type III secretory pathway component EscS